MRRVMVMILAVVWLTALPASAQQPTPPEYLRFCDTSNPQPLIDSFNQVIPQFEEIDESLVPFDSGSLTFLEGVLLAEDFVTTWEQEVAVPDCLLPLKVDVDNALNDLLLAMLYGQIENLTKSNEYMESSRALREKIRTDAEAAIEFLSAPDEVAATSATDPNALRSAEELNPELQNYLLNNGVTVLDDAGIQVFPGNTLVLIQLNRFAPEYDLPNVLFTLDRLAELIGDWPETQEISSIVVETYEGTERVLVVTASGTIFRDYYYNGTLTKDQFESQLVVQ